LKKQFLIILSVVGPFIIAAFAYNQISSRNDEAIDLSLPLTNAALLKNFDEKLSELFVRQDQLLERVDVLTLNLAERDLIITDLQKVLAGQSDVISSVKIESQVNFDDLSREVEQLQNFISGILSAAAGARQEELND